MAEFKSAFLNKPFFSDKDLDCIADSLIHHANQLADELDQKQYGQSVKDIIQESIEQKKRMTLSIESYLKAKNANT